MRKGAVIAATVRTRICAARAEIVSSTKINIAQNRSPTNADLSRLLIVKSL
jgi:hypothetical protein